MKNPYYLGVLALFGVTAVALAMKSASAKPGGGGGGTGGGNRQPTGGTGPELILPVLAPNESPMRMDFVIAPTGFISAIQPTPAATDVVLFQVQRTGAFPIVIQASREDYDAKQLPPDVISAFSPFFSALVWE
jgi:hypothetical protein